jgi:hypothetical protein
MTSAVGDNHLPESLSGPCGCFRYHELNTHKVTKSPSKTWVAIISLDRPLSGVPAVGGEGVDHHERPAQSWSEVQSRVPTARGEGRDLQVFHQIVVQVQAIIHNVGDWARWRAGKGAEALQRRTSLGISTHLTGGCR